MESARLDEICYSKYVMKAASSCRKQLKVAERKEKTRVPSKEEARFERHSDQDR